MKTKLKTIAPALTLGFCLILFPFNTSAQNVGINETGAAPEESALLDLNSTNKGFLITRADTADIFTPAFGLMTLAPEDSCLYMHNGESSGRKWISIGGVGYDCSCSSLATPPQPLCSKDNTTIVKDVISAAGKTWMDRNLGAIQVATKSDDSDAYGDLYQWGRCADGHEKRNSGTTPTLSPEDIVGHSDFITAPFSSPNDWRSGQNDNLWQGEAGVNNPCPSGYRLPMIVEYDAERLTVYSDPSNTWKYHLDDAYSSPLKLTQAGARSGVSANPFVEDQGGYWTSTISGENSRFFAIASTSSSTDPSQRKHGRSVRCIKD